MRLEVSAIGRRLSVYYTAGPLLSLSIPESLQRHWDHRPKCARECLGCFLALRCCSVCCRLLPLLSGFLAAYSSDAATTAACVSARTHEGRGLQPCDRRRWRCRARLHGRQRKHVRTDTRTHALSISFSSLSLSLVLPSVLPVRPVSRWLLAPVWLRLVCPVLARLGCC